MSKRYYLCDILGDGTEENPFRPAVADHGVNWSGEVSTGDDGRPNKNFALAVVATNNHGKLLSDSRIDPLPEFPLDGKISAMHTAAKNGLTTAMQKRGIPTDLLSTSDGYREAIRGIGRYLNPNFHENNFDVSE